MLHGQMTLTVEMVTPAIAKKWLEQNTGNRRLRETHRGPVQPRHEGGQLGSGSRWRCALTTRKSWAAASTLNAIVKSGKARNCWWRATCRAKAIAMMDRGLVRTLNDVANFLGAEVENRRAGVARMLKWGPRDQGAEVFRRAAGGVPRPCGSHRLGVRSPHPRPPA